MIRHTTHSVGQCRSRGFDTEEVAATVNRYEGRINNCRSDEVIVVLHVERRRVWFGGDSGDCVVAFVDPVRRTIKTVTWQRWGQIERKAVNSDWVNPETRG